MSLELDMVSLPPGEPLVAGDVRRVTAEDEATVVLLAGPVGCGKTTILASLYESFNEGPVSGLLFAGSQTMVGFERICHSGRVGSGLSIADTVRTNPSGGVAFLHLNVADIRGPVRATSLLVSDVTGEAFNEARDSSSPKMIPVSIWRRADVICIILDGHKLSTATTRDAVRAGALSLLRATHEAGRVSSECRLSIVTTKWDLVAKGTTEAFVADTEALLSDRFGSGFRGVTVHHVAARPQFERVPYAYGVPHLLASWVSRSAMRETIAKPTFDERSGLNRFAKAIWQVDDWVEGWDVV